MAITSSRICDIDDIDPVNSALRHKPVCFFIIQKFSYLQL